MFAGKSLTMNVGSPGAELRRDAISSGKRRVDRYIYEVYAVSQGLTRRARPAKRCRAGGGFRGAQSSKRKAARREHGESVRGLGSLPYLTF